MLVIGAGDVVLRDRIVRGGSVVVDGERIVAIDEQPRDWPADVQRVGAGGGFILPGFVDVHVHGVAGYDVLVPDDDDFDNYNTVRIGANNYFIPDSHAAKLTIDFSYFIDATTSALAPPNTLTGLLATDSEGEWNLRAQMQLMF